MSDLVEVRLLGYPLEIWLRAREHYDELMREFALIALRPPDSPRHTVPGRLVEYMAEITAEFAASIGPVLAAREAAVARGERYIDLTYQVPPHAREVAITLGELMDEADAYCTELRLLTLATPPDALALRRWYLREFVEQIDGRAPTPWEDSPFRAEITQTWQPGGKRVT